MENIKCLICENTYKSYNGLSYHITHTHHITIQEYYDKYIKQTNEEGICPICSKSTAFLGLTAGYRIYCSKRCSKHDPKIILKTKQTVQEKYGVTNAMNLPEAQIRAKQTNLSRYDTNCPLNSSKIRNKIKQTNLYKYGTENIWASVYGKQQIKNTLKKRYDVENAIYIPGNIEKLNSEEVKQKAIETKRKNHTFNTSKAEDKVYDCLIEIFGKDDIERNYKSDVYLYLCDFYIKSLDLYIECNFHWTHGGHWYNSEIDSLDSWSSKAESSRYYQNAINVWSIRDVAKRNTAKQNNLNYIVFWTYDDFLVWVSLGCPIGIDWKYEYTWLPNRLLINDITINELSDRPLLCTSTAKWAQFEEFFKRELELWNSNRFESFGTLQSNLYANRLHYIHKNPIELSTLEILRGLNISGKLRAYSTFNNIAFKEFIIKYGITSLYDPCAGWGERLITCAYNNIEYFGIDVNQKVIDGHAKIIDRYNLTNQITICDDSSKYDLQKQYDATFTCPPYWNTEIYTEYGAENLSYEDFLIWWKNVIIHSNSVIFAYQINQRFKDDMNSVITNQGYIFIEEIELPQKSSHFNRKNDNQKTEYESIQIFKIK